VLLVIAASGVPELGLVQRAASALGIKTADIEGAEGAKGLVAQRGRRLEFVHPLPARPSTTRHHPPRGGSRIAPWRAS